MATLEDQPDGSVRVLGDESIEAAAERQSKCIENGKAGDSCGISRVYEWPWISGSKKKPWLPGKPDYESDRQRLVEYAIARLARDLAEQAERAKPIDAEWCLAHGAATDDKRRFFRWKIGGVGIYWDARGRVEIEDILSCVALESIATRGQLEWLIRAVKGGVA